MRSVTTWMGLVATALIAGCASEPAKDSTSAATAAPIPAVATEPAAQASTTNDALTAEPSGDDHEVVCRNEKTLGTRIGKRVCKTRAQLKLEEESARQMMKNRDHNSHGAKDPIAGGG